MAIRSKGMAYLKRVKARGKVYGYFDTGQKDDRGRRIYAPLGPISDPAFGAKYAAMLGHRTRRAVVTHALTTGKLLDLYQRSDKYRSLADSTRKAYDLYLNSFVQQLPTAPAGEVERRDVVLMIDNMADRPAAANLMLGALRAMYGWGRSRAHVTNDPCHDIELLKVGEHKPWPDWLVAEAIQADDAIVRLAVNLLYFTAQRINEVCKMHWADITPDGIAVRQQKTKKEMMIPIHTDLKAILDRTPKTGLTIIADGNGRRYRTERARVAIKGWLAERTDDILVPHGLRKNAVNALLECGCTVAETAAISGQSLRMVEYYAQARNQKKLAGAAILKWEKKA